MYQAMDGRRKTTDVRRGGAKVRASAATAVAVAAVAVVVGDIRERNQPVSFVVAPSVGWFVRARACVLRMMMMMVGPLTSRLHPFEALLFMRDSLFLFHLSASQLHLP